MLNLNKRHIDMIQRILALHAPHHTVWVYGSRIKGCAHEGSDLDLVLMSPDGEDSTYQKITAFIPLLSSSSEGRPRR